MVARTIQHVCSAPGSSARFVPRAGLLSCAFSDVAHEKTRQVHLPGSSRKMIRSSDTAIKAHNSERGNVFFVRMTAEAPPARMGAHRWERSCGS
jgi:hypothetical protein